MDKADGEQVGTGGGLRYLTEEPVSVVVNQEQSHSCQAACARQLLKDAGLHLTEQELLDRIGYLKEWGTTSESTARVLDELHPNFGYAGGAIDPGSVMILFQSGPWIASLKTDRGTVHAVVVDRLEDDVVHVRDPWGMSGPGSGMGTRATLRLSDFLDHWHWALNNTVFPKRRK